jgi:hypothetical protein
MRRGARTARPRFVTAVLLLGLAGALASACTKHDALILLELRASGPLGAPIARIRLSAFGWPTRSIAGAVGAQGFRVGYYGPGDGNAVTVTAEALDDTDCVRGRGSAGVAALAEGATSAETRLFIRPTPESGCAVLDAGGGGDAGGPDAEPDAGTDAGSDDAGTDAGSADVAADADIDAIEDAGADTGDDAGNDSNAD